MVVQWVMKSKMGPIYLAASEKGLRKVLFEPTKDPQTISLSHKTPQNQILRHAVAELEEYFAGSRQKFTVPLDLEGTPFQLKVWQALSTIPFGQTCSYRDVAHKIKNPNAMRAVGSANGKNPICIIIPCHRVIAADGTLGGYTGGLNIKTKLLTLEQEISNPQALATP